jgi:hypothetical protein
MLPGKVRLAFLASLTFLAGIAFSPGHSSATGQEGANGEGRDGELKRLQRERIAVVRDMTQQDAMRAQSGKAPLDEILASTRMLAEAELEGCQSDEARVIILQKIVGAARDTERVAESFARSGQVSERMAHKAKAERLHFEIELARAKCQTEAKRIEGNTSQGLHRSEVALAEKRAAIKQAAVKVATAQRGKAQAGLAAIRAQLAQAKAAESYAEKRFQRFNELVQTKSIGERLLDEQRYKLEEASAKRVATEGQVAEAESQLAIEQARVVQAQLEFEEAQLRLEQLKARLQAR